MIRRWLLLLAGCSWLAWRQLCNHIQASVRLLLVPIPEGRNSQCSAAMGAAAQPSACLAVHVLPLQQDACEGALQQLLPRLLATCEGVLGLDCEWQPETQSKQHNRQVACVQSAQGVQVCNQMQLQHAKFVVQGGVLIIVPCLWRWCMFRVAVVQLSSAADCLVLQPLHMTASMTSTAAAAEAAALATAEAGRALKTDAVAAAGCATHQATATASGGKSAPRPSQQPPMQLRLNAGASSVAHRSCTPAISTSAAQPATACQGLSTPLSVTAFHTPALAEGPSSPIPAHSIPSHLPVSAAAQPSHTTPVHLCVGSSPIPEVLRRVLEDSSIIKAGVGIQEDVRRLRQDYGVEVKVCFAAICMVSIKVL